MVCAQSEYTGQLLQPRHRQLTNLSDRLSGLAALPVPVVGPYDHHVLYGYQYGCRHRYNGKTFDDQAAIMLSLINRSMVSSSQYSLGCVRSILQVRDDVQTRVFGEFMNARRSDSQYSRRLSDQLAFTSSVRSLRKSSLPASKIEITS
jgi:hypothetical protein